MEQQNLLPNATNIRIYPKSGDKKGCLILGYSDMNDAISAQKVLNSHASYELHIQIEADKTNFYIIGSGLHSCIEIDLFSSYIDNLNAFLIAQPQNESFYMQVSVLLRDTYFGLTEYPNLLLVNTFALLPPPKLS